MTLDELSRKPLFENWEGYVPEAALHSTRAIFRDCFAELKALGDAPGEEQVLEVLGRCTERLNELDGADAPFIMTIERDDLCAFIDEIGAAFGIESDDPIADAWRDW